LCLMRCVTLHPIQHVFLLGVESKMVHLIQMMVTNMVLLVWEWRALPELKRMVLNLNFMERHRTLHLSMCELVPMLELDRSKIIFLNKNSMSLH
jgi:hypothetical protein